jgi:hypothetical protein
VFNVAPGRDYYWSVQAVDTSFAGSPFAAEQQFTVAAPRIIELLMPGNGHFQFSFSNEHYPLTAPSELEPMVVIGPFTQHSTRPKSSQKIAGGFTCTLLALLRKALIINGAGEGNRTLVIIHCTG